MVLQQATVVGRGAQAGLDTGDMRVSRRHLELRPEGELWVAVDLGSRSGTWVEGGRVDRVPIEGPITVRLSDPESGFPLRLTPVDTVAVAPPSVGASAPAPLAAQHSMPALTVTVGGRSATLSGLDPATIGREEGNTLVVDDPRVSRVHATLRTEGGRWWLDDQGSTNGTFAGGGRVTRLAIDGPLEVRLGEPAQGPLLALTPVSQETGMTALGHAVGRLRIGRAADNDVVLTDLTVSRHHAELLGDATRGWEVIDLGSANGTFVAGQRVSRGPVKEGDRISFGSRGLVLRDGHLVAEVDATRVTLEAIGLAERSPQGVTLLDDVTFRLGEHSFLAAVGPSGAGKTTLLGALTGLRPADTGTVRYDGIDLAGSYEELRLRVGYVPQEDILHPQLTPRRALRYAAELRFGRDVTRAERAARVDEVLGELGLTERADLQISKLSGGQRKRVSIALELLTRPSLLFLDEPTSGLDPGMEKHLMQLLRQLSDGGRTVVVVTHSVQSLNLCDRVLFLAPGGRIAYFGPADSALDYFRTDDLADVFSELERRRDVDWKARFLASPLGGQVRAGEAAAVAQETRPPPERRRQGRLRQLSTLTRRYTMVLVSDRGNLILLLAQAPILALFVVLAIRRDGYQGTAASLNPGVQVALFLCVSATYLGAGNAIREIVKELPLFIRERTIGLSITAYLGSKVIVLSVITIVQALVLVYIGSLRQGPGNGGAILPWLRPELLLVLAATGIASMGLGLLVSALVDRPDRALTLLPVLLVPQLVLSFPQLGIQDRPLLNQISYVASAQWGYAAFASSIGLNHMVYVKARSISPVIPAGQNPDRPSTSLVQQVQTATDLKLRRRWGRSPTVWLLDMGCLGALLVLELAGAVIALRRRDAARAMRRQRRRRRHEPRDGPIAAA